MPHLALLFLAAVAATAAGIVVPLLIGQVLDGPIRHGDPDGLFLLGGLALLMGVVEAALVFVRRWVQCGAAFGIEAAVRNDVYAHLQRLPVTLHDRWQSGQLLSRVITDLGVIRRFFSFGLIFLIINLGTYLVVVALLLHMHWQLGLVVAASAVPLFLASRRFTSTYLAASRRLQDEQGDLTTLVEESALGLRTIKSFGRHGHMAGQFAVGAGRLHTTAVGKSRLLARSLAEMHLVPDLALGIVVVAGAWAVAHGDLTIGTLVAFVSLQLMLIWPIDSLGWIIANAEEAMTGADRVFDVLDAKPSIMDSRAAAIVTACTGLLRFEGVGFHYPGSRTPVLRDVDLEVRPGETLAVVGATGSGKTTLVSLVPRLHDVTSGRITLDGRDIRDLRLASLRRLVVTAFEEPTLFSMSVRENLTLGRPNATDDDIRDALAVAQADFVYDLPWALDTRIGEQGLSLSGGQRQRLALARAVLCQPKVLVLDDPLSALDVHTEALVEAALARVLHGTTALLVVHRPSTVALADRVALLADGRIAAVGTHSQLLATVPAYRAVLSAESQDPDDLGLVRS